VLAPLRQIDARGRARYTSASDAQRSAVRRGLDEQISLLIDQRDIYVQRAGATQWDLAIEHLTLLSEAEEILRLEPEGGAADRRVLSRLATLGRVAQRFGAEARSVIWTLGHALDHDGRRATLASHLKAKLVKDCVVATSMFESGLVKDLLSKLEGEKVAVVRVLEVEAAPRESCDSAIAAAAGTSDRAWFDLRGAPEGPVRKWLESPVPVRAATRKGSELRVDLEPVAPASAFDLVLYVKRVTPLD